MVWARGHQNDWDFFAQEANDPAWGYDSVLNIYRRIEDWHGAPDPAYRGSGGPVFVQPAADPSPVGTGVVAGARAAGIPTFENQNGRMMESDGGASIADVRIHKGKRLSVFRSYTFPYMDRPNLTVLTGALVTRVTLSGKRATGVEIDCDGRRMAIRARSEVVLSLGAIHTPKVLMQSGIGDQHELQRFGIPVAQHLPGVGANFQDHVSFGCVFECQQPPPSAKAACEATVFWKSRPALDAPDLQICHADVPVCSAESAATFHAPRNAWTLYGAVVRPKSRGRIRLTGPNPHDPVQIEANMLSHPDDMRAAKACVELCREIGHSAPLRPYTKREVMPGNLKGSALDNFIRNAVQTYHHQTCTAKMGHDALAVVDGRLKVFGIENLRIADGSIMPRVVTGNTMAACIVIGERASELLRAEHGI
jgi:choline dehydrogenase